MAQVASYQVPAHPSGLDMRLQLNEIVLALVGDNAGPTEPVETFPGMWWGDTTAMRLRRRNNINDAWIDIGPLNDPLADIRQLVYDTAAWKVDKRGDYMSGGLFMRQVPLYWQNAAATGNFGYISSYGDDPNAAGSGIGFVDSSFTLWNFQVNNNGTVVARMGLNVSNGGANIWGPVNLRQHGAWGEVQLYATDGSRGIMRGRGAYGGMEWVNNAYTAVILSMDDAGAFLWPLTGARLNQDGNIFMSFRGQYLSDALAYHDAAIGNAVPRGAQVIHGWDFVEFASLEGGGNTVVDLPSPWWVMGLRITVSADINRIYQRSRWGYTP
ncbi:hypothetical protein OKW45_001944 [Paraburkholderia sp. WSM4175]|uniref:hypothetical protein n=1 Tax=Paraburkholderia sp. WSM4175 TaxID=2991072 RepID=UPI003D1F2FBC